MQPIVLVLQRFIAMNRAVTDWTERHLPQIETHTHQLYMQAVGARLKAKPNQVVVDVGAGRTTAFAGCVRSGDGHVLIGVDVSAEEMEFNDDLDEMVVADAVGPLPFDDNSVDLVASSSSLEHFRHVTPFLMETHRILKPDGYTIHVFPSKFAPHAIINRFLPDSLSRRIVHFFVPDSAGTLGFPAFYDHTYASGMTRLFQQCGFEVVDCQVNYNSASFYFGMFYPMYLFFRLYEQVVRTIEARNLAAMVLLVARKP